MTIMAKVYDSANTEGSAEGETGRRGGSAAAMRTDDKPFRPADDATAITSEKSSVRFLIPLLVAIIIFGSIFFITSRFSGNSGRDYKAGDAPVRPGTESSVNSGVSGSAAGR